jgi:hypothetical protein
MRSRSAFLAIATGALAVSTVLAQSAPASPGLVRVQGPAMTVAQALQRAMPSVTAGDGFAPKVIQLESAYYAYLIPSAGSVQGAGGTYYRSDFSVGNYRASTQTIGIGWIAQGVDNSAAPLQYFDIPANRTVMQPDVVAQSLHKSGLGSIIVFGETSPAHDVDQNAQLLGFSRIWSNQPNASGTVSLQFPAVSPFDSIGSAHAYALGLRHDSSYRTNVGIINLDSVQHTWTVRIVGLSGTATFNVTVLPYSMKQTPLPSGVYGDLFLDLQPDGSAFPWSAYGAAVDNITGDGWVARAIQP